MWLAAARLHQRRRNEGLSRAPSSRLRRSVRRPGSRLIRRQSSFPSLNQDSDMTALAEITDALHKLRVSFVQSLVNVAAQRIGAKGMDHDQVLIYVSGSTIGIRSEEHTSELQSLMRTSYAVFCLQKKKKKQQ